MIRTGPCSNILYNCAINILNEVTGQKWGYIQYRVKITYITCEVFGAKFAVKGKNTRKNIDHFITTRTSLKDWEDILKFELYRALLTYIEEKNITVTDELRKKLSQATRCGVAIGECNVLSDCHEVNRYNDTFIHADATWITTELSANQNIPRILTRDDFI